MDEVGINSKLTFPLQQELTASSYPEGSDPVFGAIWLLTTLKYHLVYVIKGYIQHTTVLYIYCLTYRRRSCLLTVRRRVTLVDHGTTYHFGSSSSIPFFCGVRVAHSLFLCVVFYRILLCPFSFGRRFTASGYLFNIFKLFWMLHFPCMVRTLNITLTQIQVRCSIWELHVKSC